MEEQVLTKPMIAQPAAREVEPVEGSVSGPDAQTLLALVLRSLEDDKAEDIVTIDLHDRTQIADFMVVASGRSTRQVVAIAEKLAERLKQDIGVLCRMEGKDQGDWVLIDCGDVIVHVFRPEVRDFYQLEKMWHPAPQGRGN